MNTSCTVFVVDDSGEARRALQRLLESAGLPVKAYSSAQEFLNDYDCSRPGCLLLDLRMPGISGLELQEKLARSRIRIPVIIVSAHGEVEDVVRAIKAGAVDFVKKPYRSGVLLERVQQALELDLRIREAEAAYSETTARVALLTTREREILGFLVAGQSTKQVAQQLGLARTTVDIHRKHIMTKLQATSVVELVHIAQHCGWSDRGSVAEQPPAAIILPAADSSLSASSLAHPGEA